MTAWLLMVASRLENAAGRKPTFESMLDAHSFFCASFEVRDTAFRLAKCRCPFTGDHPLVFLNVDLITKNNLRNR